ncbi:MAG: hypothetical protein S4CHLAM20_06430 [Chlamydiia bacterium]|nr:hypothetical protein [Chlamydiia bacterium]
MLYLFTLTLSSIMLLTGNVYAKEISKEENKVSKEKLNESEKAELTEKDIKLLSQAYGHMIGQNLNSIGLELDNSQILQGIQNAFEGVSSPLEDSQTIEMITAMQERKFKNECESNLKAAEAFLSTNKSNKNVVELEKGKLQYKQIAKGSGKECKENDTPIINYKGKYLSGEVFGHSEKAEPIALNETIEGFRKSIVGMKIGEKREVYIHPELGYGVNSSLAPNALLTFEIELTGMEEPSKVNDELSEMKDLPGNDTFALDAQLSREVVK